MINSLSNLGCFEQWWQAPGDGGNRWLLPQPKSYTAKSGPDDPDVASRLVRKALSAWHLGPSAYAVARWHTKRRVYTRHIYVGKQVAIRSGKLIVHPCSNSVAAKPSGEAQAGRSHRKIRDEIPQQANQLHDRRDEREDGGV